MAVTDLVLTDDTIRVLDHGFVRLDDVMASDLSVVNGARVSFARRKEEMDDADAGLIRFLMRDRHGTPFEHNAFRFHIRCPIFVAREWMRHRVGCLTGDTEVTFVNRDGVTGPELRKTVDQLWKMWTEGEINGHVLPPTVAQRVDALASEGVSVRKIPGLVGRNRSGVSGHVNGTNARRDGRWRVRRMRLRVLNEETNEFGVGHISDIVDKGVQPVYRISLADGKKLTLTETHRVLTDEGWKTMREAVGLRGHGEAARMTRPCALLTNGAVAHRNREWLAAQRAAGRTVGEMAAEAGCSYHTIRKWLAQYDLQFASGEAMRGRRPWNEGRRGYKTRLRHTPEHKAAIRAARSTGHPVHVSSIEYVGPRQTYDLCVDGPWHNFVANGVVVHNSFNEFSMRYAKATDDFYVPDPEDVRAQVGKPGAYTFDPVDPELAEDTREALREVYEHAYSTYERLVEAGVAREVARSVLPVGAYTEFYWTVNARSLMNFVSLRASETAQREIRRYAEAVESFLEQHMPITYAAFVASGRVAP